MGQMVRSGYRERTPLRRIPRAAVAVVRRGRRGAPMRQEQKKEELPPPVPLGEAAPRAVVLTPDEKRLFIAYGQSGTATPTYKGIVGVIDLTKTPHVHRSITITLGGNLLGIANEWHDIKVSPDGRYVYAIECGLDPKAGLGNFVKGFVNGAKLCIVDALVPGLEREIASLDTNGFEQEQMAVDRLGRNLWIPRTGKLGVPELLRVDIDRRSSTQNKIVARIRLHAKNCTPRNAQPGPSGVAVTSVWPKMAGRIRRPASCGSTR